MNSSNATLQKDRVDTTGETSSGRCPDCTSQKTAVPVVTVRGTTLWRCAREDCSETWRTPAGDHEGFAETPAPERVLDRLVGATRHHDDGTFLAVAGAVSGLYRDAGIEVPDVDWAAYEDRFEREQSAAPVADD